MHTANLFSALDMIFKSGNLPYLQGKPGIGKSAIVEQWAEKNDYVCLPFIASHLQPEFISGIPIPEMKKNAHTGKLLRTTPELIDSCMRVSKQKQKALLFLDELPNASPAVHSPLLQLFHERRLGEFFLPKETLIASAGNPPQTSALSADLPEPLLDRLVIINHEGPTKDDWLDWAYENNLNSTVLGFIYSHPEWLHSVWEEMKNKGDDILPTPRSWVAAAKILDTMHEAKIDDESLRAELISGVVGREASMNLETFVRHERKLFTLADILAKPKKTPVHKEIFLQAMQMLSLGRVVETEEELDGVMPYVERHNDDIGAILIRRIVKSKAALLISRMEVFHRYVSYIGDYRT